MVKLDHCMIHVTDWARSNAFYADVMGFDVVRRGDGYAYRFGDAQLNLHGPGVDPHPVARDPVRPGNSDLCFEWPGPIAEAAAHLTRCKVEIELGRSRAAGRKGWVRASTSAIRMGRCLSSFPTVRNRPKLLNSRALGGWNGRAT